LEAAFEVFDKVVAVHQTVKVIDTVGVAFPHKSASSRTDFFCFLSARQIVTAKTTSKKIGQTPKTTFVMPKGLEVRKKRETSNNPKIAK